MRFSIVTPVYNAEKYLPEMLASVRSQTLFDWELRIVDDGSEDETPSIIREAIMVDPRIKPLSLTENSGSDFLPRRLAIESSEGDYIVNIDADDMVEPDYLMKLDRTIRETNADAVYDDMCICEGESRRFLVDSPLSHNSDVLSGRDALSLAIDDWKLSGVGAVRQELALQSLCLFDETMASEPQWNSFDNENLTRLDIFGASSVAFSNAVYFYRQTAESVTHLLSPRRFGILSADMKLVNFTKNYIGKDSEEYILANRQLFHHVVESIRYFIAHRHSLKGSHVGKLIRLAHKSIDFKALHNRVSPRYRAIMRPGYHFTKTALFLYDKRGGQREKLI